MQRLGPFSNPIRGPLAEAEESPLSLACCNAQQACKTALSGYAKCLSGYAKWQVLETQKQERKSSDLPVLPAAYLP